MGTTRKTLTPEEKWESLTLANNFIFCKVMESNPELCKHLLEMLLHIKIDRLAPPTVRKDHAGIHRLKGGGVLMYTQKTTTEFLTSR